MKLSIFAGSANPPLAESVAAALGVALGERVVERLAESDSGARWR